ncbi:MAG TPA: A24 family peptidase [Tepidisphaeraceae bacterium]|nr:A24 family peptidase [Tepidisphaeraceae bacterium]
MSIRFLEFAPLLAGLVLASVQDWRRRRIANLLTIPLLLAGVARSLIGGVGMEESLLGIAVGFGLMFVLFAMRAVGGGDVKLLAAVGAWVGPLPTLAIFAGAAIVGMLIVIGQAIYQHRMPALLRNTFVLTVALAQANGACIDNIVEMGNGSTSVRKPLPYAIPVLTATVVVLVSLSR